MCAAVVGPCGSPVPHANPWPNPHKQLLDEILRFFADRHAELQSLWQDIGEDTWQKLQLELSQMVSNAFDEIYKKVLEERRQRKSKCEEERVCIGDETRSEKLVEAHPSEVISPMELQSQGKLSMANLEDFTSTDLNVHSHIEDSVVSKKLCSQVLALREMLKLPLCNTTHLEEVLAVTIVDLHNFCLGKLSSSWFFYRDKKHEFPPMLQLLQCFYRTLQATETFQTNFSFFEATEMDNGKLHDCEILVSPSEQDSKEMISTKRISERGTTLTSSCNNSFGCCLKRSSPRSSSLSKGSKLAKPLSEDLLTSEKLARKIIRKLEDTMKHLKYATQQHTDTYACSSSMGLLSRLEKSGPHDLIDVESSLEENRACTKAPTGSCGKEFTIFSPCVREDGASTCHKKSVLGCGPGCPELGSKVACCQDRSKTINESWIPYAKDLEHDNSKEHERFMEQTHADTFVTTVCDSVAGSKHNTNAKEMQTITASKRWPLVPLTNNQLAAVSEEKPWHGFSRPPPPPPPPPLQQQPKAPLLRPPPPPLPPPPRPRPPLSCSEAGAHSCNSAKLKKSPSISRLYMTLKKKAEGAASNVSTTGDVAVQRKTVVGLGNREGMAGALAEITKRSAYFQKIEDDVNKQANSILEMKSKLETFETDDMNELLKFHRSMESQLEQLTDESQVLARFEGFPMRKLETVRAAAALYLRLTSLVEQIDNWVAEPPPLSEQLEKVTVFFDKVKADVEAIERTKDEDFQRFSSQKICFDFKSLNCIKEATVRLSSQCLASTLEESHSTERKATIGETHSCTKDINKQRASFQMLYKAFQLAYRVHNFAGGHDERAEQLCPEVVLEMETYPSSFWADIASKQ